MCVCVCKRCKLRECVQKSVFVREMEMESERELIKVFVPFHVFSCFDKVSEGVVVVMGCKLLEWMASSQEGI